MQDVTMADLFLSYYLLARQRSDVRLCTIRS